MLIVNADDLGFSPTVTDPLIEAYDEGAISSASAMVWTRDSERAAKLARERQMPVGLHLNLTLPFTAATAPSAARELQGALAQTFDKASWFKHEPRWRWRVDVRIREAVDHQLTQFRELYGEPTHIDGHHHIHVHPAVLLCLPANIPIRPVMRSPRRLGGRRDARERLLRRRFVSTDGCVSLRDVHSALGGSPAELVAFATEHPVEVIVHAQYADEREALRSREWWTVLRSVTLGSYRDLITS